MIIPEETKPILTHQTNDVEIYVYKENDEYVLTWGDYIANVWEERYTAASVAFGRAAALTWIATEAPDHDHGFMQGESDAFEDTWHDAMPMLVTDYEISEPDDADIEL